MNDDFTPPRLAMRYAGAEWVQAYLDATHKRAVARAAQRKRPYTKPAPTMSPLGITAADILGFMYQGIYHLPHGLIEKCDWSDRWMVRITVPSSLCTWDNNNLMWLIVVASDMMVRVVIDGVNQRYLKLGFSQRTSRTGSMFERMPTIETQIEGIRRGYTVEPQSGVLKKETA